MIYNYHISNYLNKISNKILPNSLNKTQIKRLNY